MYSDVWMQHSLIMVITVKLEYVCITQTLSVVVNFIIDGLNAHDGLYAVGLLHSVFVLGDLMIEQIT